MFPKKTRILRAAAMHAVNAVLPPRCVVTGDIVGAQGMISPAAFKDLSFIADPFCKCCGVPFAYDMGAGALCAECLSDPPPYDSARAAVKYDDASRPLILGFKHGDKTHAAPGFVPWMERAAADILSAADMLVPVPLYWMRLVSRRYNQAAIIAAFINRNTGINIQLHGLRRVRSTVTQGHMRAADRAKNVRGAFAANPAVDFKNKNVIIVDDVYTTGATVKECARVLKKSGAARVDVLTLARVTKGDFG
jgi:ComF family protein